MNKKQLSESDICAKFITPAILAAKWDEHTQLRREVHFTKGQIHVRGKMTVRGKSNFADYILYYKPNIPIAIVEAKDNNHAIGDGLQQGLRYGESSTPPARDNLCHQAIFMNHATGAVTPLDPEMAQVGNRVGQRAQWRGLLEGSVRTVLRGSGWCRAC